MKPKFTFTKSLTTKPMSPAEWETCEDLLAKLVARAIAVDVGWLNVGGTKKLGTDQT